LSVPKGLAVFFLVGTISAALAQPKFDEPLEVGTLLLAGRVPWGVSALPSGYLIVPCEDKTVSVVDEAGRIVATWRAADRFSAPATVSQGPQPRVAFPQMTGRVEVCAWDAATLTLAAEASLTHQAEAAATAWGPGKTLVAAWKDGHVEAWSQGRLRWMADAGTPVFWLLFDQGKGVYAAGKDRVILYDGSGREAGLWDLAGIPRGMLETLDGTVFVWNSTGLWARSLEENSFRQLDASGDVIGVAADRQGHLIITKAHRFVRTDAVGTVLGSAALPRRALTAAVVDDRGRLLVGTEGGVELWAYDGRFLGTLDSVPVASELLLTDRGAGAWGDSQWTLHLWKGFQWPPYGWPVAGGSPGRSYCSPGDATVAARAADWLDDAQFSYLFGLVASGEEANQAQVLDLLEAKARAGPLLENLPFANVLLLKLIRSGLTDLLFSQGRVTNNWPGLRLRAQRLLSQSAGLEDRTELLDLSDKEFDPLVAAEGARALARSGWDGDGKVLRQLRQLLTRMPDQPQVAQAVLDAAISLWQTNGMSTDPALIPLVQRIYQGPYPRATKLQAQKFFQDLAQGP
jgi:hypothetical protein